MEKDLSIRRSTARDIDRIMEVYESAKYYMRTQGNFGQWIGGYPDRETIMTDIAHWSHYLAEDEEGRILMVFSFILGEDPTYKVIENGQWLNHKPYGTIHRIASNGIRRRMLKACVDYCKEIIDNIRIDTHADNSPMQNALHRLKFSLCGIIYTSDGSPRLAFQKDFRREITMEIDFRYDE
ncbi:MAG: GNAT family N-acetyltransferase [Muribaculaceae bacterium]|nr:GNAT family N-acetyltransferase [Muribaculaceae bacterium]